jgi:ABC-2 type transport system permease protein
MYIAFQYYLWSSIFSSAEPGAFSMTLEQTVVYVTMSIVLLSIFNTAVENSISQAVLSGDLIRHAVRPVNYHLTLVIGALGGASLRSVFLLVPALMLLFVLIGVDQIPIQNIPLFILSCLMSFLILVHIDLIVGLLAFMTETIWGMRLAKEIVVMALSGALVPIQFFPQYLADFVAWLPFQAICHTPVSILTGADSMQGQVLNALAGQLAWVLALYCLIHFFFGKMMKNIKGNGG